MDGWVERIWWWWLGVKDGWMGWKNLVVVVGGERWVDGNWWVVRLSEKKLACWFLVNEREIIED